MIKIEVNTNNGNTHIENEFEKSDLFECLVAISNIMRAMNDNLEMNDEEIIESINNFRANEDKFLEG